MSPLSRNITLILFAALFSLSRVDGAEKHYQVSVMTPGLRKEADAVIRHDEVLFEVEDAAHARKKVIRAVTIFSKEGRPFGKLELEYGQLTRIADLDGRIYNEQGEEVAALEDRDMHDFSAPGSDLYTDERERTAELYYDRYPYTVEYTYELSCRGIISWPDWYAQESGEPVEYSRFEIIMPDTGLLRYRVNRDSAAPAIAVHDGKRSYVWEARNLPELKGAILDEDLDMRTVVVLTAPSRFTIEDYAGDMSTWQLFGRWYQDLVKERTLLPESARRDIEAMSLPTDPILERIRKVYRYMQGRTRYVSVQLGIGGWQPFDPVYVHERGYGDCKALSNYTVALLKAAGVQAYPVLILSGNRGVPFYEQFPSQQFNHEIVCVPTGGDSLWLECTSQTLPAGRITHNNEARYALLINENGGTLVRTPGSISRENGQRRIAHVAFTFGGEARASVRTTYTGDQHDFIRRTLEECTREDRRRWIVGDIGIENCRLDSFSIQGLEERKAEMSTSLHLTLTGFASSTDSRYFFQPNLMERRTKVPKESKTRRSPVRLQYPYCDTDSIYFVLPKGCVCEALPKEVFLRASFGSYSTKTMVLGDSLVIYARRLEVKDSTILPERYQEYRAFFTEVVKADRALAVLAKNGK